MMQQVTQMTYEYWFHKYEPYREMNGIKYYETYGEDYQKIMDINPFQVWTVIDAEGEDIILNGIHFVNRISYIITANKWQVNDEIEVSYG
jgi:hypothetical protein